MRHSELQTPRTELKQDDVDWDVFLQSTAETKYKGLQRSDSNANSETKIDTASRYYLLNEKTLTDLNVSFK